MGESNKDAQMMHETTEASELSQPIHPTPESIHDRREGRNSSSSKQSSLFNSRDAYSQLNLLIQLFDNHLSSVFALRHSLNKGESTRITFENLWLLFDLGELIFVRHPGGKGFGQLPGLSRVTNLTGGRVNPYPDYKDLMSSNSGRVDPFPFHNPNEFSSHITQQRYPLQNQDSRLGSFYINAYKLESDGESFGPLETEWVIPAWDGERAIHDLECFPVRFCRAGIDFPNESIDAWKHEIIQRGKQFSQLTPETLREYHGIGVDDDFTERKVN